MAATIKSIIVSIAVSLPCSWWPTIGRIIAIAWWGFRRA
jgi:hypothetical protein